MREPVATESKGHTRDSIEKTAKQFREGGLLRHLTHDQAVALVRKAVVRTPQE